MGEKLGLEGCYKEAKAKNFTVFGYQYGVQCYSSATVDAHKKYGKGTKCSPRGTGGPLHNQVYEIGTIVFSCSRLLNIILNSEKVAYGKKF